MRRWTSQFVSVISQFVSVIFILAIVFAIIEFVSSPSEGELTIKLNKEEYERHFRALVHHTFVDSTNRHLFKLALKMGDTTVVYWPRYIKQADMQIIQGDSLIKIKESFTYEVKRGDSSFFIHVKPLTVK